jgi:hypothetical protein
MSTAAGFLDIEETFDTMMHSGLLYKLPELEFSTSLVKLIVSFLTDRKFKVLVENKFYRSRIIAAGVPQGFDLLPTLYSLYINDAPTALGIYLALFANDPCIYATQKHERRVSSNCNAASLQ